MEMKRAIRIAFLLLAPAISLCGEFLRVHVSFDDIGCASCIESLQGRLERARGVERVEIDAAQGLVALDLAPGNRVRLTPLLSRITQDGTKILSTEVEVLGTIRGGPLEILFQPSGLTQTYRLQLRSGDSTIFEQGAFYRITGSITRSGSGDEPVLVADSVALASQAKE